MSGPKRKRESLAPSLFPFLAVLLCTMGSLVLILMLIVSAAQADAEQITQQIQERKEELVSLADHAVDSYRKKLESSQLELEKKRLQLQHYEEHILELSQELKELEVQYEQAQSEESTAVDLAGQESKISDLERQLAEAEEELKELETKPQGDKPIFAVIPYRGPNGTHRRPIYLECTSQGIVLQPEGNLISLQDLQPPHGPGNPLDAALRAVRAEYKPASGAITRTAYPLLLVRPSGIRAYALARSAMSGWDDQFGYELIEEELELAYPEGRSGLHAKVEDALALARERQAALVMAMPGRYQMSMDDLSPLTGSQGGGGGNPAASLANGGSSRGGPASGDQLASSGQAGSGGKYGYGGGSGATNFAGSLDADARSSDGAGGTTMPNTANALTQNSPTGDSLLSGFGQSATGQGSATGADSFGQGSLSMPSEGVPQPGGGEGAGSGTSVAASGSLGSSMQNAGAQAGSAGSLSASQTPGSANSMTPAQSGQPTAGQFASSASGGSAEGGGSSNAAGGQPGQSSGDSTTVAGSQSGQSYPGMSSSMAMQSPGGTSAPSPTDQEMAEQQQAAPQFSMNVDLSEREQSTRPVAAGRGRDWAWSDGPRTQTPIVRSLYLHCYDDRWILLPENGNPTQGFLIPFDGTPEERAELLAKAVQRRVEEWGFALAGGYWKPELVVDVAPGAEWRFRQLVRLFEASGLDIRQRTRTASRREAR